MAIETKDLPVLVSGGGIGGLAAALALVRQGFQVQVFEQSPEIGEIGAGIQLGPNAFHAFDALGVGDKARGRAVYTDYMVMHDAIDETQVGKIETGEAFRKRFGNPYAVIHRVDIHSSLLEGAVETGRVEFFTNTRIEKIEQDDASKTVTAIDQNGKRWVGQALIGADGGKSVVRAQYVNDPPARDRPCGVPRGGRQGRLPRRPEVERCQPVGRPQVPPGALPAARRRAVQRGGDLPQPPGRAMGRDRRQQGRSGKLLPGHCPKARQLIDLPKTWRRWATADKEPIGTWVFGRATILGDAAHPTTQYMAQGACMAMEDAVTLGEALRVTNKDWDAALALYQKNRVTRTARIVLSGREMGRLYHAMGVERLIRNSCGKAAARSASTTPSNGCTAGTSTTVSPRAEPPKPAPQSPPPETPHA
jgi:2-polyprenyl-6-methoxyphenol hydroxylase-like FAD-dependent oxidoreductase